MADRTIERLIVELGANAEKFRREFASAGESTSEFDKLVQLLRETLKDTQDGLERFSTQDAQAEMDKLAKSVEDLDAAPTEQQVKELGAQIEALTKHGATVPPALRQIHEEFRKLQEGAGESSEAWRQLSQALLTGLGINVAQRGTDALVKALRFFPAAADRAFDSALALSDSLTNLSGRTGQSIEALQRFGFAGLDVGVSMDEIATATTRLQRSITGGSTEVRTSLGQLGLSLKDVRSLAPDKLFYVVMESLNGVGDSSRKTALAMQLLGRGGAALLPLADNLRTTAARADELGVVLSDKAVKATDDLGDSMTRLQKVTEGLGRNIVAGFTTSPPVKQAIDETTQAIGYLSRGIQGLGPPWREMVGFSTLAVKGLGHVGEKMLELGSFTGVLASAWVDLGKVGITVTSATASLRAYAGAALSAAFANTTLAGSTNLLALAFRALIVTAVLAFVYEVTKALINMMGLRPKIDTWFENLINWFEGLGKSADDAAWKISDAKSRIERDLKAIAEAEERRRNAEMAFFNTGVRMEPERFDIELPPGGPRKTALPKKASMVPELEASVRLAIELTGLQEQMVRLSARRVEIEGEFVLTAKAEAGQAEALYELTKRESALRLKMADQEIKILQSKAEQLQEEQKHEDFAKTNAELALKYAEREKMGADNRERATKALERYVELLDKSLLKSPDGLLQSTRFSGMAPSMPNDPTQRDQSQALGGRPAAFEVEMWGRIAQARASAFETKKVKEWADYMLKAELITKREWEQVTSLAKASINWGQTLQDVKNAFDVLGISADSVLGRILGGMTSAINAGNRLKAALFQKNEKNEKKSEFKGWGNLSSGEKAEAGIAAIQGIASVWKATEADTRRQAGLQGAMAGAAFGAQFGVWGAVIGGALGGLLGVFRARPEWQRIAKEVGSMFGMTVSKEMAEAIQRTAKDLKLNVSSAALLHLTEIADKSGKDIRTYSLQIFDLMKRTASGTIPMKQGMEEIGKAWAAVRAEAEKYGIVGDRITVQMLQQARAAGILTQEMKGFVSGQLDAAIKGLEGLWSRVEKHQKIDRDNSEGRGHGAVLSTSYKLRGGLQPKTEQDAREQATIFSAVFWATVKEKGVVAAGDAMRAQLDAMKAVLEAVGFDATAILAPIEQMMALTDNELFRGAAEGAGALDAALKGLANSGYLTVDAFRAFEGQANNAFGQALAGGLEAGLTQTEAERQALLAIAPLLQSLKSTADQYGITLDENTQKLIDQAKANGVAFKDDPTLRLIDSINALTLALGGVPPAFDAIGLGGERAAQTASASAATAGAAIAASYTDAMAEVSARTDEAVDKIGADWGELPGTAEGVTTAVMDGFVSMSDANMLAMETLAQQSVSAFQAIKGSADESTLKIVEFLGRIPTTIPVRIDIQTPTFGQNNDGSTDYDGDPSTPYLNGGVARGPRSGYGVRLHGREAIIPLEQPSSIAAELANLVTSAVAAGQPQGGGSQTIILQVGADLFKKVIEQGTKNGTIRVHASAVRDF